MTGKRHMAKGRIWRQKGISESAWEDNNIPVKKRRCLIHHGLGRNRPVMADINRAMISITYITCLQKVVWLA